MARTGTKRLKTVSEQEESRGEVLEVCRKQESGGEAIVTDDWISSLPDCLLHHILSFLPTRQVVATSLLSKRWRPLWHSMPTFNFVQEHTFEAYRLYSTLGFFIRYVDSVLLMADLNTIKKVRLDCGISYIQLGSRSLKHMSRGYQRVPLTRMNIWINTFLYRKVEHLELCSEYSWHIEVPSRIFNSSTIRVLKLEWIKVNIPSCVKLPSLKVLHLENVLFPDDECLAKLLSGCPLLEELVMLRYENEDFYDLDQYRENGFTANIEKLEHLVSANVQSCLFTSKALTNVTRLRLNEDRSPVHDIPAFDNLTYLEIACLGDEPVYWIVECLRRCPKLETLVIDNDIFEILDYLHADVVKEHLTREVPQCLSSHLKEFTFKRYTGLTYDFEIARYIMEKGQVLRTVSIKCFYDSDSDEACRCLNTIASCPRGSEHCRLSFV